MAAGAAAALAFLNQESRVRAGGGGGLRAPGPVTMDSFFFGIEHGRGRAVRGGRGVGAGERGWAAWVWARGSSLPGSFAAWAAEGGRPSTWFGQVTGRAHPGSTRPGGGTAEFVKRPARCPAMSGALALAGCELSGHTRSFTFKVEEEEDTEHVLALNMVRGCAGRWGAGATDTLAPHPRSH